MFNCFDCNCLFWIIYRVDNPILSLKIQFPIAMKLASQRFAVYLGILSQFSDFGSKTFSDLFVILSEPFFRGFLDFNGERFYSSYTYLSSLLNSIMLILYIS